MWPIEGSWPREGVGGFEIAIFTLKCPDFGCLTIIRLKETSPRLHTTDSVTVEFWRCAIRNELTHLSNVLDWPYIVAMILAAVVLLTISSWVSFSLLHITGHDVWKSFRRSSNPCMLHWIRKTRRTQQSCAQIGCWGWVKREPSEPANYMTYGCLVSFIILILPLLKRDDSRLGELPSPE